jgi:hypothetical protein
MRLKEIISHDDAITLLEITNASLSCSSESQLKEICLNSKTYPFDYAACAVSGLNEKALPSPAYQRELSRWIHLCGSPVLQCDPVFIENFNCFGLQY